MRAHRPNRLLSALELKMSPVMMTLLLALLGWGLYLANVYALVLAFAFVPCMNRFQIRPEERALRRSFGQQFREYCGQVRRWL